MTSYPGILEKNFKRIVTTFIVGYNADQLYTNKHQNGLINRTITYFQRAEWKYNLTMVKINAYYVFISISNTRDM